MNTETEFTYVEITKHDTGEVVKRMDVTGMTDRQIEKIIYGANINLNHDSYSVDLSVTTKPKEKI